MAKNDPEESLAALIKHAFKDELDVSQYSKIESINVDKNATCRLFVAMGAKDGMDKRKIINLINMLLFKDKNVCRYDESRKNQEYSVF